MTDSHLIKKFASRAAVVAGVLLLVTGCSKSEPMGTVQGRLTVNGKPFSNANLQFMSSKTGRGGTAEVQSDGTFKLSTPMEVGTYTVILTPKTLPDPDKPAPRTTADKGAPEKYWNEVTSDITAKINAGPNDIPIELKK